MGRVQVRKANETRTLAAVIKMKAAAISTPIIQRMFFMSERKVPNSVLTLALKVPISETTSVRKFAMSVFSSARKSAISVLTLAISVRTSAMSALVAT